MPLCALSAASKHCSERGSGSLSTQKEEWRLSLLANDTTVYQKILEDQREKTIKTSLEAVLVV